MIKRANARIPRVVFAFIFSVLDAVPAFSRLLGRWLQ
jgi:hypothetical protein